MLFNISLQHRREYSPYSVWWVLLVVSISGRLHLIVTSTVEDRLNWRGLKLGTKNW